MSDIEQTMLLRIQYPDFLDQFGESAMHTIQFRIGKAGMVIVLSDLLERYLDTFLGQDILGMGEIFAILPARGIARIRGSIDGKEPRPSRPFGEVAHGVSEVRIPVAVAPQYWRRDSTLFELLT
ncbi:hypothetical protein AA310_01025 [Arthrobacter sp. YC-RL1]|nr:hypothetical protein ATC04_17920 [Arthrobacter sp. YC-RL1]KLI90545.1 hypothetical protein AA310_01025 [Arthrobacter sp. YC-RL1]